MTLVASSENLPGNEWLYTDAKACEDPEVSSSPQKSVKKSRKRDAKSRLKTLRVIKPTVPVQPSGKGKTYYYPFAFRNAGKLTSKMEVTHVEIFYKHDRSKITAFRFHSLGG